MREKFGDDETKKFSKIANRQWTITRFQCSLENTQYWSQLLLFRYLDYSGVSVYFTNNLKIMQKKTNRQNCDLQSC
jgi:hypothetical protein